MSTMNVQKCLFIFSSTKIVTQLLLNITKMLTIVLILFSYPWQQTIRLLKSARTENTSLFTVGYVEVTWTVSRFCFNLDRSVFCLPVSNAITVCYKGNILWPLLVSKVGRLTRHCVYPITVFDLKNYKSYSKLSNGGLSLIYPLI